MAHVLYEAELQEEWTESFLLDLPKVEVEARLQPEIDSFDRFLGAKREDGSSLRDDLLHPERRAGVRRTVRAEIRRRLSDGPVLE